MTRGRAAIAAVVVGVAMGLAGAGISHTGQIEPTQPLGSDPSLTVEDKVVLVVGELDVSGDRTVLVAGEREERSRGSDGV